MQTWLFLLICTVPPLFHIFCSKDRLRTLAGYCQMFLVILMITAGMGKLTLNDQPHWQSLMGPVWLEEKLAPYGLGLFARFIAWCQVVVGLLLASRRFMALGAVALMPILISILAVTVSLNWNGTPYVVAGFIAMNIVLLLQVRRQLLPLIGTSSFQADPLNRGLLASDIAWAIGSVLILTTHAWLGLAGLLILALPYCGRWVLKVPVRKAVPW